MKMAKLPSPMLASVTMCKIVELIELGGLGYLTILQLCSLHRLHTCYNNLRNFNTGLRWPIDQHPILVSLCMLFYTIVLIRSTSTSESRFNNIEGKNVRPSVRTSVCPQKVSSI